MRLTQILKRKRYNIYTSLANTKSEQQRSLSHKVDYIRRMSDKWIVISVILKKLSVSTHFDARQYLEDVISRSYANHGSITSISIQVMCGIQKITVYIQL